MTGSFNKKDNKDFDIFIDEKELALLENGTVISGDIDYYWNDTTEVHHMSISRVDDAKFRQLAKFLKENEDRGSWRQFMHKAGLARKESHHMMYLNCDLLFQETWGGKVFEQRYCEWLFDKIFIFIETT